MKPNSRLRILLLLTAILHRFPRTSEQDNHPSDGNEDDNTEKSWLEKFGHGICQNDQGGPLVTWIGGRETVIGVASAFLVTTKMECKGPFIFASTACSSKLILCVMRSKLRRSAADCDQVAQESGQRVVETVIDWENNKKHRRSGIRNNMSAFWKIFTSTSKVDVETTKAINASTKSYLDLSVIKRVFSLFTPNVQASKSQIRRLDVSKQTENNSFNDKINGTNKLEKPTNLSDWVSKGLDQFFSQKVLVSNETDSEVEENLYGGIHDARVHDPEFHDDGDETYLSESDQDEPDLGDHAQDTTGHAKNHPSEVTSQKSKIEPVEQGPESVSHQNSYSKAKIDKN
ncbi:uncharacterized protein LOC113232476 [Hyposmocoma kahamanoa]|uniref:uncharacterized protein LOC113232476 n=1 Tax=Hyposmocoma kahamanoa TaxID=1477025 RepID=UPI000E6D602A|nr:uncharacterized protein LOC113232476 [Hyposmocoma kahamanoa]